MKIATTKSTFSFSNKEVAALKSIYDMLSDLNLEEYEALCAEAEITTDFYANLDCFITFAQDHRE